MSSRKQRERPPRPWEQGFARASEHLLLAKVLSRCRAFGEKPGQRNALCPPSGWAVVVDDGSIAVNAERSGTAAEWEHVFAHAALHLAFGHHQKRANAPAWNVAACIAVTRFLDALKIGTCPLELSHETLPVATEEALYTQLRVGTVAPSHRSLSISGEGFDDLYFSARSQTPDWGERFASGLTAAVESVIEKAANVPNTPSKNSVAQKARRWLVDHFPLLGGLAMQLELIEDPAVLSREGVCLGAVNPAMGEVYLCSGRLDEAEARFVLAHELLHVGLAHLERRRGRDAFLWNVACDFVINQWLVEMGVGAMPAAGGLYDASLNGLSAEAIYDRIVIDRRRYRRSSTFKNAGEGDVLEGGGRAYRAVPDGMSLDEFYRSCLARGLEYHQASGRGLLPAGLIEEIRALQVPPVPWDVELGRLFDAWFPPLERRRSYAKPSRRQSSTPEIARPSARLLDADLDTRTFGVVLDTSGSMDRSLLAQALGAMSSYALSRDVPRIRVVHCDAAPYDQGYIAADDLMHSPVRVHGRGGTVLQPGIDLLENARDFPPGAPIMVLTDGQCDVLRVKRAVAYLVPEGRALPFVPTGPLFRLS